MKNKNQVRKLMLISRCHKVTGVKVMNFSISVDIQINGIESGKSTFTFFVNWFSTRMPRKFNEEGIVFSTNDAGTKERSWRCSSNQIKKLAENEL